LFFLQIIKFEEVRKNCSYIIVYNELYIIIYEQFFFISSNLIICKKNNVKIIFLIIIFLIISIAIFLVSNIRIWLLTVSVVSSQKPKNVLVFIQAKRRLTIATLLSTIIDSHVRNISGIESENEWAKDPSHLTCDLIVLITYDGYFLKCSPFYAYARFICDIRYIYV